jgi:hypothetical protein
MSPPEVWGPPIWTLFHVLAEKINESMYSKYASQILNVMKMICSALPCPECTHDATIFLLKIKIQNLRTKEELKNMVYLFHNYVNAKKRKPLYNHINLDIYKKYNIIYVFNKFISVYNTKGNMKLLAESFQRQTIIKNVREWLSQNIYAFIPPQEAHQTVPQDVPQTVPQDVPQTVPQDVPQDATQNICEEKETNEADFCIISIIPNKEEQVIQEEKPVIQQEEQVIQQEEPVTQEEEPVIQQEEPVIQEEEQVIQEEEPVIQEEEQVIQEEEPVIQEEEAVIQEETNTKVKQNNKKKKKK